MTQEQFEMVEQMLLDIANETVVTIANFVRNNTTESNRTIANEILDNFLFKDLNELRAARTPNIFSIDSREAQTKAI